MPTTVTLCRWNGGWLEVTRNIDALGRKEMFLSVGAAQSVEEALALGAALLVEVATVREGVVVETDPDDAALPYLTYEVGDTIQIANSELTLEPTRVSSVSMTENDDGVITWVPEAGTLLIGESESFTDLLKTIFTKRGDSSWSVSVRPRTIVPTRPGF